MTISNFPLGFLQGVTIRGVPLQQTQPGEVFWVNSTTVLPKGGIGASNGNRGTYTQPFSTLDFAIGKCTASRGDIILLMPGFTETVSSATSIVIDVAGIAIVGLGAGTLRPKLSFTTATAAAIPVSAANVSMKNIVFSAEFADVVEPFTLTAVDFHLEDCAFVDDAAGENFIQLIDTSTTDNEVDNLSFLRCSWITPDLLTTSMVDVDADIDGLSIVDCYLNLGVNTNDLPIFADVVNGKDLTNLNIVGNTCIRLNDANPLFVVFGNTTTTNTGIVSGNFVRHLDVAGELLVTAASNIGFFENFATAAVDKSGAILPAIDTIS